MRKITDIQIQETFTKRGLSYKFYPRTGDYMLERDTAIRGCEKVLFERLIRDHFIHMKMVESYTYDLTRLTDALASKGFTVTRKSERHIIVTREMQFNISDGGGRLRIYNNTGTDLLDGTEDEIADFIDNLSGSFNRIHSFVCKMYEEEQQRYKIAKVAQATGMAHIPENMECIVMPIQDGKYSVTLWHCAAVYEHEDVKEEDLSNMKEVLYRMHLKDPVKKILMIMARMYKLVSIFLFCWPVVCFAQNTPYDLYLLHMDEAARIKGSNVKHEKNLLLGCYYMAYSALDTPIMEGYPDTKDKKEELLKLAASLYSSGGYGFLMLVGKRCNGYEVSMGGQIDRFGDTEPIELVGFEYLNDGEWNAPVELSAKLNFDVDMSDDPFTDVRYRRGSIISDSPDIQYRILYERYLNGRYVKIDVPQSWYFKPLQVRNPMFLQ